MLRPSSCRFARRPSSWLAAALLVLAATLGGCTGTRVAAPPAPPQATSALPPAEAPPQAIALGAPATPALPGAKVAVALLLPLSGPTAGLGRAMLDAAEMALFDVGEDNFLLLPRDTQGTAEGAARAAESVLAQGARLILGPLLAGEVAAVKPIARQANVNMIAFSTDETLAGDGTYLLGFPPRQNVERITAFAHQKGVNRFAALAPETPYGQLVVNELRAAAARNGSSVDHVEFYDPAATDIRPVVRQLASFDGRAAALARERKQLEAANDEASKLALARLASAETAGDLGFDAVLLPEGGAKLKQVAALLPYFDIDPGKIHILGTGLWDEPGLGTEPALVGGWFAAPSPAARADFAKRFQQLYKQPPVRLASLGYDAVALAAVLAKKPGGSGFTAQALTDPSGFAGVDGIFRFRPDGRADRGLAVLQVERNGTSVVSPAPETFEGQPAS